MKIRVMDIRHGDVLLNPGGRFCENFIALEDARDRQYDTHIGAQAEVIGNDSHTLHMFQWENRYQEIEVVRHKHPEDSP